MSSYSIFTILVPIGHFVICSILMLLQACLKVTQWVLRGPTTQLQQMPNKAAQPTDCNTPHGQAKVLMSQLMPVPLQPTWYACISCSSQCTHKHACVPE